eukprot:38783-Eustigmatos_ZCMA.PRE.1
MDVRVSVGLTSSMGACGGSDLRAFGEAGGRVGGVAGVGTTAVSEGQTGAVGTCGSGCEHNS